MSAPAVDGATRIERALRQAVDVRRIALAPFLTAGFPAREGFAELLDRVANEADLIELGVPFSDPMADGVTIQRSSRIALEDGVNLSWILETVRHRSGTTPIVLMSYLNPLLAHGLDRLAAESAAAGVSGMIVPDLPLEECAPLRASLSAEGLALVQLVTPVTPAERLALLCAESSGFVYAVTQTATTGSGLADIRSTLDYLDRVRAVCSVPVLAGFGIREARDLQQLTGHADGAIVGSALIEALERRDDPAQFLRGLRTGNPAGRRTP